jgi:hypothetical protein
MNSRNVRRDERGAAVILALLIMMLLTIVGLALVTLASTESLIAASYRHSQEAAYGAEAAFERALLDLDYVADWSMVLGPPNVQSTFTDGSATPPGPDGQRLDLARLTLARQAESDDRDGPAVFGANAPQWRLFAHAPIQDLLPPPGVPLPLYLVVWVADDGVDGDGDGERDSNGRVMVHAAAIGMRGTRRAVEGIVARSGNGLLTVVSWHRSR